MKTSAPGEHPARALEESTGRIEAFSDGIFGVAITLLAIDLKAPALAPVANHALLAALLERWPDYLAVLSSFASVLLLWVAHHSLFRLLRRTDVPLMLANGLVLLLVVGVPYPASILGQYLLSPAAAYGACFYAAYCAAVNLAFLLLWYVARHGGHRLKASVTPALLAPYRYLWVSVVVYALLAALALAAPLASVLLCNAMWVYWSVFYLRHSA